MSSWSWSLPPRIRASASPEAFLADPNPGKVNVAVVKGHFPFFDMAYQGFASGDPRTDAKSISIFLEDGHFVGVAHSYAKNMGLYGHRHRVGCLSVLFEDEKQAVAVKSQLQHPCIVIHLFMVETILGDPDLKKLWLKEVKEHSKHKEAKET